VEWVKEYKRKLEEELESICRECIELLET